LKNGTSPYRNVVAVTPLIATDSHPADLAHRTRGTDLPLVWTRMTALSALLPTGGGLRDEDWARRHRLLNAILGATIVALTVFGAFADGLSSAWLITVFLVLPCVVAASKLPGRRLPSTFVALGFTAACGGFVAMAHGLTEAHFTFFIAVAALALYRDWTPFGMFLLATTLHHGVFGDKMRVAVQDRTTAEARLRRALAGDQEASLPVWFQPIVGATGEVVGAETLVRMVTPEDQLLGPGLFVPVAEETGLVVPLGEHVLALAVRHLLKWSDHLEYVSVNVSPRQLAEPEFVPDVAALLARNPGLDPSRLILEITETALLDSSLDVKQRLEMLKMLGVRIALDDFGTGYSSLTWLQSIPADIVKLDRSFVAGLSADPRKTSIIEAVLWLARSLNMSVVAEGVEDEADWAARPRRATTSAGRCPRPTSRRAFFSARGWPPRPDRRPRRWRSGRDRSPSWRAAWPGSRRSGRRSPRTGARRPATSR
jgi:EAL domain-containing protein (putative c-di-GMP-specific phosphodiesterase class I)